MEPIEPFTIFEQRFWREDEGTKSIFNIPRQFSDAQSIEERDKISSDHQLNYSQVNLHFSGEQLQRLRILSGGNNVSIQDALTAYLILTLNKSCYSNNDQRRILHSINNEFAINSNDRFDWSDQVHFGYKDQTRFYTIWSGPLYLRVFRLNPMKHQNHWLTRDLHGAQVSFRIEKDLKQIFLNAIER